MANTLVFVLLLLCSFSLAHRDKEEKCHSCLSDIHAVLRQMSAALAENRLAIKQLETRNNAELTELNGALKNHISEVASLKKRQEVGKVAFFASLSPSGEKVFGPFNSHVNLVFERMVTNIGNAYNPKSGVFTAPVKGAYHFELYIYGPEGGSGAALMKNNELISLSYENQANRYGSSANAATLTLEVGDVVFPLLWAHTRVYDNDGHHSTFSGHLLFTM